MPYPYQFQNSTGFGGNNFAVQSNPSPASYPTLGNVTAASRVAGASPAPAPASPAVNPLNVTAGSKSTNPFGLGAPDLSAADPNILNRLDISSLVYNANVGGYYDSAKSYKGGMLDTVDPAANLKAQQYYSYIGGLPTVGRASPALMQLGGGPSRGPSYNSILGGIFNNASPLDQSKLKGAGFGPTYGGPYKVGGY